MKPLTFRSVLLGTTVALALAACQKDDTAPDNTPTLRPLNTAERQTLNSSNDFAYRAFGTLRQEDPQENLFMSPLSISAALTMAYNGADGTTKDAMKQTLGFQPMTDLEINQSYQSLFALLGGIDSRVTFTAANSIWHAPRVQLAPTFAQTNQTYFGATVQSVPFGNPAAAATINNWVSTNTQGKIPTILDATMPEDVLYLINAIYFKGAWTYQFNPQLTRPEPFRLANGSTRNVDFMTLLRGKYLLFRDAQQQVIDLPYGNRQYSMTLVVPQGTNTLDNLSASLSSAQLGTWLAAADTSSMELHLPKFKLASEKDLKPMLTQLGMGVAFGGGADFGRLLANSSDGLAITSVKHKAVLEVNEEGSEAAAVTSVGIGVTSLPPSVRVDRPFIFLIREKSSNAILFMGQLTNPQ
jgi:serine protease inhibitor